MKLLPKFLISSAILMLGCMMTLVAGEVAQGEVAKADTNSELADCGGGSCCKTCPNKCECPKPCCPKPKCCPEPKPCCPKQPRCPKEDCCKPKCCPPKPCCPSGTTSSDDNTMMQQKRSDMNRRKAPAQQ